MLEQRETRENSRAGAFQLSEKIEENPGDAKEMNISASDEYAVLNATLKKTHFRIYIQMEEYMIRVLEIVPVGDNYIQLTIPVAGGTTRSILVHSMELLAFSPRIER